MKVIKVLNRIFIIIFFISVLVLLVLFINEKANEKVIVTKYTYKHSEVPEAFEGYKILMISDMHEAPFSERIAEHIKKLSPDIIVFTGDMALLPDKSIRATSKIAKAVKNIPMYAVSGNHETQCGYYDEIITTLWQKGITPLDNDSVCIERGDDSFLLLGIKDPVSNIVSEKKLEEIRKQIESEFPDGPCFSILLSHRADLYPMIKDTSADLILSGHMHGGVMRLPFLGGVVGKNEDKWFPNYEYGMYVDGEFTDMIVSGGCDKNPEKKRYFNPPEIVLITLEREEN